MVGQDWLLLLRLSLPPGGRDVESPDLDRPQGTLGQQVQQGLAGEGREPATMFNVPTNTGFVTL